MNQEWFLKKATEKYPIGTEIICLERESSEKRGFQIGGVTSFDTYGRIWFNGCGRLKYNFCVYKDEKLNKK